MKKSWNREKVCLLFVLMFVVQMTFMLSMRSSTPGNQGQGQEATIGDTNRLQPFSLTLTKSKQSNPIICDQCNQISDWCYLNRSSVLDPNKLTLSTINFYQPQKSPPVTVKIRPYPRKWENNTMSLIHVITVTTTPRRSSCRIYHNTPALVFSAGGYTGNIFHDFNDGIIPLFITIETLFNGQDVTLVVANFTDWWYSKYEILLSQLTSHRVINLHNQTATHCFPSAAVGLVSHGPMTVDPTLLPSRKTFLDFRALLGAAYDNCHVPPPPPLKGIPRLVFVSRAGRTGRVILNQDDVVRAAEEVGFDVVVFRPNKFTWLCDAYKLIDGSHAVFGVHGAAMTHALFLRPGAVFVQVVPLGNEWLAETYFKKVAVEGMKFEYLEYKLQAAESSLVEKYGKDDAMIVEAREIASKNWTALDTVYLKGQDVRLDVERIRVYLRIAYLKARRFMEENG